MVATHKTDFHFTKTVIGYDQNFLKTISQKNF